LLSTRSFYRIDNLTPGFYKVAFFDLIGGREARRYRRVYLREGRNQLDMELLGTSSPGNILEYWLRGFRDE